MNPADYPWVDEHARRDGVLHWDRCGFSVSWSERVDLTGRVPVAAVGSNASPAVLARKLATLGTGQVPLSLRPLAGVRAGHSAHVSTGGYIPAAPYVGDGELRVVVGWFLPVQVDLLDASEPNYTRRALSADVEGYVSRWGVVSIEGRVVDLTTQHDLLERLRPPALAGTAHLSDPRIARQVSAWLQAEHAADAGWPG